jgi:ubiquinone/menaquinone biosynthesis C-methylase UbiE
MTNWFDRGGAAYALRRPDYPGELAAWLAESAPGRKHALDVGCGTGQFTRLLAGAFDEVTGFDPSADQLAHAAAHPRIRYVCAPAEKLDAPNGCADLITAAQAAHWFDLPAFYDEARRVAAPGAVLALISYGAPQLYRSALIVTDQGAEKTRGAGHSSGPSVLDPELDARFQRFYTQEIGPYWPAERRLVDSGYRDLAFPFTEIEPPRLEIRRDWDLAALLGYIGTWSATRRAQEAGADALLERFAADLAVLWGDPATTRVVRWPINGRICRL